MRRLGTARLARCLVGVALAGSAFTVLSLAVVSLVASASTVGGVAYRANQNTTLLPTPTAILNLLATPTPTAVTTPPPQSQSLLCTVGVLCTPPPTPPTPPSNPPPTNPSLPGCIVNCTNPPTGGNHSPGSGGNSPGDVLGTNPSPSSAGGAGTGTGVDAGGVSGLGGGAAPLPGNAQRDGGLVQPPPPSITLATATGGINFGKAPFLWPLFVGLDLLGVGAVVLVLRRTWSRPVAD